MCPTFLIPIARHFQMPRSHRIDITYSGDLRKEGSLNCGSQKMTIAPKGSHAPLTWGLSVSAYPTDLLPQSQRFRLPRSFHASSASLLVRWHNQTNDLNFWWSTHSLRLTFAILLGFPASMAWAITDLVNADWCACHSSVRLNGKQKKKKFL